jgi:SAM-dependent methyltransferase
MNNPRDFFSNFNHKTPESQDKRRLLDNRWLLVRKWYQTTDLGQALLAQEKKLLSQLLEQVFGYNLVQLGCLDHDTLTTGSRTSRQYIFESLYRRSDANDCTQVISSFEELPIQNQSIDAAILPHTLEFEENPHQILREVDRILVAEGKLIFLGFNPFSLWGFWHKYWEVKNRISNKNEHWKVPLPSCGNLITQKRLKDWLKLMGFDIDEVNEYFYRPPLNNAVLLKKLAFIERAGELSRILPAGSYLMIATKRVSTLTPIPQAWKFSKSVIGSETAEPAGFKPSQTSKNAKN